MEEEDSKGPRAGFVKEVVFEEGVLVEIDGSEKVKLIGECHLFRQFTLDLETVRGYLSTWTFFPRTFLPLWRR